MEIISKPDVNNPQKYTPHCTTSIVDIHGHPTVCGWYWKGPPLTEFSASFELDNHYYSAHGAKSFDQCSGFVKPVSP